MDTVIGRTSESTVDGSWSVESYARRLRDIELFADLDENGLRWVAAQGSPVELADQEVLFEDGQVGEHFYVLLDGELLFTRMLGGREELFGRQQAHPDPDVQDPEGKPSGAHQFTGELQLLAGGSYIAKAVAIGRTELLAYDRGQFMEILTRFPIVCRVLLPVVAWKIHFYEERARYRSMLEALGTLAAGLAHELNNPTAALMRSARLLRDTLPELTDRAMAWTETSQPAERDLLDELIARLTAAGNRPVHDALAAADAADLVQDWLDEHDIDGSELSITLADLGMGRDVLDEVAAGVRPGALAAALGWLDVSMQLDALVTDVAEAGGRIESLVRSTKIYSNLDRAPQQDVDVIKGLEATVAMLAAKLRRIRVHRHYTDLPPVRGYPGELNQVWTNLIDNAVDAMGGAGELHLTVRSEAQDVLVEVRDNGPGVSTEVQGCIFTPFFTTKDIGRGSGLGLHLCRDIVTQRHGGAMELYSVPGDTRFVVRLPVDGGQR